MIRGTFPRAWACRSPASETERTNSEQAAVTAKRDNQRSDNYVLCVVLFAASLFFAGISTKIAGARSRIAILALGYLVFLGTVAWILTFPVSFSV